MGHAVVHPRLGHLSESSRVLGLREDAQVRGGGELAVWVLHRHAHALEIELVKLVENTPLCELGAHLRLLDIPLVGGRVARGVDEHLALESALVERGELRRGRRRVAADTRNAHAVLAVVVDSNARNVSFDVAVEVYVAL